MALDVLGLLAYIEAGEAHTLHTVFEDGAIKCKRDEVPSEYGHSFMRAGEDACEVLARHGHGEDTGAGIILNRHALGEPRG